MRHLPFDKEEFSPILIAPLVQALFHCLSGWQRPPRAAFLAYGCCYDRFRARARSRVHDRVRSRVHDRVRAHVHDRVHDRGHDRDRVLKGHMSAPCTVMKMIWG